MILKEKLLNNVITSGDIVRTFFLRKLVQKTRFADAHVTDDDVFENIRIVVWSRCHALSTLIPKY